MADLSTFASAAAARSEILTDPGSTLAGLENGDGIDVTDLILTAGSNSDGYWARLANNRQICIYRSIQISSADTLYNWTYPLGFGDVPVVIPIKNSSISDHGSMGIRDNTTTSVNIFSPVAGGSSALLAIGTWGI
jgi:hypothetical protein